MFFAACSTSDEPELFLQVETFPNRSQDFSMWQIEPFLQETQMGYILKTDDGKVIVVDGGGATGAPFIENYLVQLGGTVHTWIITHGHQDHMGTLVEILNRKNIKIERLIHAPQRLEWVQRNEKVSVDVYTRYLNTVQGATLQQIESNEWDTYILGDGVHMEVISAGNPEIVHNAINNSSLVFKITSHSKSILFLGDMGRQGGDKILANTNAGKLSADYVQMAHHGQHGVEKDFYAAVKADYALWPTPKWLWDNQVEGKGINSGNYQTITVREWMQEIGVITNYVSGLEGTIQID